MENEWKLDFFNGRVEDADGKTVCYVAGGPTEQAEKHGHLIAAVPELLEALEKVISRQFWTVHEDDCDCAACERYKEFIGSPATVEIVTAIRRAKVEPLPFHDKSRDQQIAVVLDRIKWASNGPEYKHLKDIVQRVLEELWPK
jgi:hypothetical protein